MRAKAIFSSAFFIISVSVQAQLYPVYSQYFFNELAINPAYAGAHVQLSATTTYRNQWINFPGAPQTISFSAHTALVRGKVGVGLMFNEDRIGSYANRDISASYSYKIKFPGSTLSFGLQAMAYFVGADFSDLNLKQADDAFNILRQVKPNVGGGIYYHKKDFFVGFSVPLLINSNYSLSTALTAAMKRNYFLRAGFIKPITARGNVKINPSTLVRSQEGQPLSVDLNMGFIFYDILSAGVSYRTGDAVISFLSLKLADQLYFNYSFDWTASHLRPFSSGTHEFMLNYRYKIPGVHKNLACPTYWNYRE